MSGYIPPETLQGITTLWLPITTPYPSVPGCEDAFFHFPDQPLAAWDPGYGYFASGTLRCLPPAATTWWEQEHQNPDGYTSISIQPLVCPEAFTIAATELRVTASKQTSTLIVCCPSNYVLVNGQSGRVTGDCSSSVTSGQVLSYLEKTQADDLRPLTITTTITTASSVRGIGVTGWNAAATTSPISTTSPIPSDTPNLSSTISTGAKAGIGVGVAVGIIAIVALTWMLAVSYTTRHHKAGHTIQEIQKPKKHPLVHEIDASRRANELDARRTIHEMNASN